MKLSEIAAAIQGIHHGDDVEIEGVGSLDYLCDNGIIYVEKKKFLKTALALDPAALVVGKEIKPEGKPHIEVEDPKLAFVKLLELFCPEVRKPAGIDQGAFIADDTFIGEGVTVMPGTVILSGARIGDNCMIYPGCVIEQDVTIGDECLLYSGVVIRERCSIGSDCILHSGTVIGSDGFGYYEKDGRRLKIPQIGTVKVGSSVEIGANCCIDRATVGDTVIGDDTKLDNMVHIAHNVKVGSGCYMAAMAAVSGSVTIGNNVVIMGQVGVGDHLSIADGTIILGKSGIHNDIKKADIYFGTPARQVREQHRINSSMKYLPELLKRVKSLEKKIEGEED